MARPWARLDNASNIFLAARTDRDPKVFRIAAELDHDVDPVVLQTALEATYAAYPLYRAVLRRGVFWYYLQDSDLVPQVAAETTVHCAPLYQVDRRTLLFRVMHHRRRISLEVFHALSDGTGALWFLSDLVTTYLRLRSSESAVSEAAPLQELTGDSFARYFRRGGRARRRALRARQRERSERRTRAVAAGDRSEQGSAVDGEVAAAASLMEGPSPSAPHRRGRRAPALRRPTIARQRAHRVRGTRTPDHRMRVVELTMPVPQVLALARGEGVSLTMHLTAMFFEAVRRAAPDPRKEMLLTASVPVNLRQFFPSTSARNFFATTRVEHRYGGSDPADGGSAPADGIGEVARALERDFRAQADPSALEDRLRRFLRFERHPLLRVVPRPAKDVILRLINSVSNRGLSVAVSNLGRVVLPEGVDQHVRRLALTVSAVRPQFGAVSHGDLLTVTFTSPFVETDHVREFARLLVAAGVDVTVAAGRVSEEELDDAEPADAEPDRPGSADAEPDRTGSDDEGAA